jgi:ABC-type ATPase involved in cell division
MGEKSDGDKNATKKITVTLDEETLSWLRETYPDALSDQEAIRMAINDSRTIISSESISISDKPS